MGCKCIKPEQEKPNEIESTDIKVKTVKQRLTPEPKETENEIETFNGKTSLRSTEYNVISHDVFTAVKKSQVDPSGHPTDSFAAYVFDHINSVRLNPSSLIPDIQEGISKITMKTVKNENRMIFESTVKVALHKGQSAFEDAIIYLNNTESVPPLVFDSNICVQVPESENELKDKEYIKRKVDEMIENGMSINAYWRDIVKDPATSFLLMVVDDNGKNPLRRSDIFNKDYKRIGITSKLINKTFAAYITFAK